MSNVEGWNTLLRSAFSRSAGGGFDIHYSTFAFLEFLFSIKLAAFQAGGADT
jgi:hypothetical protein